jgi:hypothetical protein
MLLEGSSGEAALVIPITNCKWMSGIRTRKDGLEYMAMPQAFNFTVGPNVVGLTVLQDQYDLATYAAVMRCVIEKGYDCRVSFLALDTASTDALGMRTWLLAEDAAGEPRDAVYELSVPSGAVGLGWDEDARDFLIGFSGGADKKVGFMKSAGRLMEDRIMVIDMPILKTVKPGTFKRVVCLDPIANVKSLRWWNRHQAEHRQPRLLGLLGLQATVCHSLWRPLCPYRGGR